MLENLKTLFTNVTPNRTFNREGNDWQVRCPRIVDKKRNKSYQGATFSRIGEGPELYVQLDNGQMFHSRDWSTVKDWVVSEW